MKAILIAGRRRARGNARRHPIRDLRARQEGLRPADPRRRPDVAPRQARHPHDGRARHHRVRRPVGYVDLPSWSPDHEPAPRRCCCCSCSWAWASSASSTTASRSAKQRSLGLRSKAKMIGQILVGPGVRRPGDRLGGRHGPAPRSRTPISFTRDLAAGPCRPSCWSLWVLLLIAGASNGVNLTDGLDGLATGASVMVFGAYVLINVWQSNQNCSCRPRPQVLRGPRPARPRGRRLGGHRRVLRLPVVERLAGQDLHGRHRLAVARRRDGRLRADDAHRAAARRHRRPVRHRSRCR